MSWEGYGVGLCKNGHKNHLQQYISDYGDNFCGTCKELVVWEDWVDQTNGCDMICDGTRKTCPAHEIPLEEATPALYKECRECHHKELVTPPTYKVPNIEVNND